MRSQRSVQTLHRRLVCDRTGEPPVGGGRIAITPQDGGRFRIMGLWFPSDHCLSYGPAKPTSIPAGAAFGPGGTVRALRSGRLRIRACGHTRPFSA